MRKLVLLFVAVATIASASLFAQEEISRAEDEVSRKVGFYLSSNSGDFIPPTEYGLFADNHEHELAIFYNQNFASAEWISFTFTGTLVFKSFKNYDDDGNIIGQDTISYMQKGSPRAKMGLSLNGSGFGARGLTIVTSLDTRSKFDLGAYYGLRAGIGYFSTGIYTETYFIARMDYTDYPLYAETFSVQAGYSLPINRVFGFNTTLYVRFCDPLNEPSAGFKPRWDMNFTAKINGLEMRAGTRLDVEELLNDSKDIDVDLSFRAGVSYTFTWIS